MAIDKAIGLEGQGLLIVPVLPLDGDHPKLFVIPLEFYWTRSSVLNECIVGYDQAQDNTVSGYCRPKRSFFTRSRNTSLNLHQSGRILSGCRLKKGVYPFRLSLRIPSETEILYRKIKLCLLEGIWDVLISGRTIEPLGKSIFILSPMVKRSGIWFATWLLGTASRNNWSSEMVSVHKM